MTGRVLPDLTPPAATPVPYRGARGGKTPPRRCKDIDDDQFRDEFRQGLDDHQLADLFGYSVQSIREHRWAIGLHRSSRSTRVGRASCTLGSQGRHPEKPLAGRSARILPFDHPAFREARTIYPGTVVPAAAPGQILVSGENSRKIGREITKGRWKGFPVFTLTLEERATCPTSCALWRSCFGSSMHLAKRITHGADLESRLLVDIAGLARRHPAGFAVRLHVLGDFYSVAYVALWRSLIERYPNLHVFGFTARTDPADPITHALHDLVLDHWPRAGLRFSNAPTPILSTVTIEHPLQKPADAIVCPAQLGQTATCSTCALCWSTERRIAFLRH